MKKIPPSERISKEIEDILHNGTAEDDFISRKIAA
jgi:hypothetical protein